MTFAAQHLNYVDSDAVEGVVKARRGVLAHNLPAFIVTRTELVHESRMLLLIDKKSLVESGHT